MVIKEKDADEKAMDVMDTEEAVVDAKVDLQTQRANTRFKVKACQPICPYNRQR